MSYLKRLRTLFKPPMYQGWGRKRNYFEGWYFKVISGDGSHAFAIIPGIAMGTDGEKHAFIQVLDGKQCTAAYHRFPSSSFKPDPNQFFVQVDQSSFSDQGFTIVVPDLSGTLSFSGQAFFPNSLFSPGIMGPFTFVPRMECYHGIVSMDHSIKGELIYKGETISFDGGRGYLEKDWGRSFPDAYIWMQTNHFEKEGVSMKCSVANIPWMGSSFVGFICALWINNELIRFTTYNFCAVQKVQVSPDKVIIRLRHPKYILDIDADRSESTSLASPIQGFMDGRIEESMTATISIKLTDRKSRSVLFEQKGEHAGLEVAGQFEKLLC